MNIIIFYVAVMAAYHVQKERNALFNDTLNTFYLRLYGVDIRFRTRTLAFKLSQSSLKYLMMSHD